MPALRGYFSLCTFSSEVDPTQECYMTLGSTEYETNASLYIDRDKICNGGN